MAMDSDDRDFHSAYYTSTCTDGHAIIVHERCGSMVLHEASLRLSYVLRAVAAHEMACGQVYDTGRHQRVN